MVDHGGFTAHFATFAAFGSLTRSRSKLKFGETGSAGVTIEVPALRVRESHASEGKINEGDITFLSGTLLSYV